MSEKRLLEPTVVKVYKFSPLADQHTDGVIIQVVEDIDNVDKRSDLKDLEMLYENQAKMIEDALYNSLPQGTYDRLVARFIQRKASLYKGKTE